MSSCLAIEAQRDRHFSLDHPEIRRNCVQASSYIQTVLRGLLVSRFSTIKAGILSLFFFALCTVAGHAQDMPDVAQGLQPYGAYHGGQLDQVSMMNGGLT